MNCKKYRACLIGMIAVVLVCGLFLCLKYEKNHRVPEGGTLVQNTERRMETWA